ncbi:MAG: CRTAC1 family protein [Pseudomonadota bacterium]
MKLKSPIIATLILCSAMAHADTGARFVDRGSELAVSHRYDGGWEHFVGGGVAVMDCNGDGFADFLAAGGDNRARLFINTTGGTGEPLQFDALGMIPRTTGVTGAYPIDIDSDGHLDLAVLRAGANQLWRGLGGCRFEDASEAWGFDGGGEWSTAFTATWEPGASLPTLVFGNYVDRLDPSGPFGTCSPNSVFRGNGETYDPPTLLEPGYCALSMLFSDWQRRGTPDLRISNDRHYHMDEGAEQMFRMPDLAALDEADGWERLMIFGMGIASRDITGDAKPEVFLTSMGDQLLQLNTGDGWKAAPYSVGTYAQRPYTGDASGVSTGWHSEFGDVDNDGRADLFIAKGNVDEMPEGAASDPNNLLIQKADGTFAEAGDMAGIGSGARARGASLADFNNDGLLDLVVVNRRAAVELYENQSIGRGGWIGVSVSQDGLNRRSVGAWVDIRTPDGRIQTQEVTIGGGHAGGSALPLHFGLGLYDRAMVRIHWPDGAVSAWRRATAGRVVAAQRMGSGADMVLTDR